MRICYHAWHKYLEITFKILCKGSKCNAIISYCYTVSVNKTESLALQVYLVRPGVQVQQSADFDNCVIHYSKPCFQSSLSVNFALKDWKSPVPPVSTWPWKLSEESPNAANLGPALKTTNRKQTLFHLFTYEVLHA